MKTCEDFAYLGIECCEGCHWEAEHDMPPGSALITIQINGKRAYVCCEIARFFYPDGSWRDRGTTGGWSVTKH